MYFTKSQDIQIKFFLFNNNVNSEMFYSCNDRIT